MRVLREITRLNPLAYAKVLRARKTAEELRNLYIKSEPNDIIGVDYSTANDLEYSERMRALERSLEKSWREYLSVENDGYGLSEFAAQVLRDEILRRKNEQQQERHR